MSWKCGASVAPGKTPTGRSSPSTIPLACAQRRDERVRRVDLGRRKPELEVELGVELGLLCGRVAQQARDVLLDGLALHARQRADVAAELGLAGVDAVEDARPGGDADVHGRERRAVRSSQAAEQLTVHPVDESRHLHRRVHGGQAIGDARVHLRPAHAHLEEGGAARDRVDRLPLADDPARLAEQRRVAGQPAGVGEPLTSEARAGLLVGGEHERHAAALEAALLERGQREDHRRRPRPSCRRSRRRGARRPRPSRRRDRGSTRRGRPAASCRGDRPGSACGRRHPRGRSGSAAPRPTRPSRRA